MPKIASVGRALPQYKLSQDEIREFARIQFSRAESGWERLLDVFKNAEINERYFSVPVDWYRTPHTFIEKTAEYVRSCDTLGVAAANDCLKRLELAADQVDYIIFVVYDGNLDPIHRRQANQPAWDAFEHSPHAHLGPRLRRWGRRPFARLPLLVGAPQRARTHRRYRAVRIDVSTK